MKRLTPYIFPLIVLAIVFFLVYRWYSLRSERNADAGDYGEGIEIENLSDTEADSVLRGAGDFETAPLEKSAETSSEVTGAGTIRYEIKDGKVRFSVAADLPEPKEPYHVWIRTADGDNLTNAFDLELGKGGYMGTAAINEDLLPLEVIVSQASNKSEVLDSVILKGVVEKKAASEDNS